MNKCVFIGNLTRDPELVPVGETQKCRFGLAVNGRPYTNKAGEKTQDTLFLDCEAWAQGAELINKFFTKGKPIIVDGELRLDQWDDKETGVKRSKHYLRVNQFEFPPKNAGAAGGEGGGSNEAAAPVEDEAPKTRGRGRPRSKPADSDNDGDIPF